MCTVGGCGRTVGVVEATMVERNGVIRTRPHNKPDGSRCVPVKVERHEIVTIDGRAHKNLLRQASRKRVAARS